MVSLNHHLVQKQKFSNSIVMLILSCQKWMVNYFKQKSFFAAKECISCATVFGKRHKKDNKLSFYPYKPDSAKDNIYRSVQKTEEKNGQIK